MKILVTGVAGFIGSKVAEMLLDQGKEVLGVDNLNDYYDIRLKNWRLDRLKKNFNFKFVKMDIESLAEVEDLFASGEIESVINLAARAGVRYSMIDPFVYMRTNAIGTLNILECMRKSGVKKIVLASTSSLYAGQPMPFSETLPVNSPISPYAASKKSAEVMSYTYHYLYDLDVTVLRYFTVYGPAGRPDMVIFKFINNIIEGRPIKVNGDGEQKRDFTYVDDIARGTVLALKSVGYEIINLGGGLESFSLNYLIKKIEEYTEKKAIIQYADFPKADIKATLADGNKAKEILEWKPEIKFDDGLKQCVDWYRENRNWAADLECNDGE